MKVPETIRLKSFSIDGDQWFTISLADKTCNCPEFKTIGGCKHLTAVGLHRLKLFTPSTRPTYSQALSGLVKSLRIRRLEHAVYWLVYLDTFREKQYRFRTARRLLIGSAEDGHSVAVMEKVRESFRAISKPQAELITLVAEAARICQLPNWWHPDSGGPDYIYHSLVAERTWLYKHWDYTAATVQKEVRRAIEEKNRVIALGGAAAFWKVNDRFGATKQAQFLLTLAEGIGHDLAARLCNIHLSAKSALSGDNNFLAQAVWMMAGGISPVAETILPVSVEECRDLLDLAQERWKNPQPIPRWCLDGVHSAGDDPRFMGCLAEMWAVCKAFQHYGRVDPSDRWLREFRCYDGLIIEEADRTEGEA